VSQIGRSLIIFGVLLAIVGVVLLIAGKLGLGRLPGDIVVQRKNFSLYVPVVTSIVVSIVLTVLANLFLNRR
jgi:hypothetical protein